MESIEEEILVSFYCKTTGQRWANSRNWCTEKRIGAWSGVKMTSNGRISGLRLENNKLSGSLVNSLGRLRYLTELVLSHNNLTGAVPTELSDLQKLECLNLSHNNLEGELPIRVIELIAQMRSSAKKSVCLENNKGLTLPTDWNDLENAISSLDLSSCSLAGKLPLSAVKYIAWMRAQGKCVNLKENSGLSLPDNLGLLDSKFVKLNLSTSSLTGSIPASLGQLSNLQELLISENCITGTIPNSLGGLSKLTELCLRANKLTGFIPDSLGRLSLLQVLRLTNNSLSGRIPASIGSLSALRSPNMDSNKLTGLIPETLGCLASLTVLSLKNNLLTGVIPETIGNLSRLQQLLLSSNGLTGELPLAIVALVARMRSSHRTIVTQVDLSANMGFTLPQDIGNLDPSIRSVNLARCALTGVIPSSFATLQLAKLDLGSNKLEGGFEHICQLRELSELRIDGFWEAFELPPAVAELRDVQQKLAYLRGALADAEAPLM